MQGRALAQELRVGHHVDREGGILPADHVRDHVPGADRDRGLVDDGDGPGQVCGDAGRRLLDVAEVGLSPLSLRGGHRDERELRPRDGVAVRGRELEAACPRVALHNLLQARLVEVQPVAAEDADLLLVDVDDADLVAQVGKTGRRRHPDIPRADYCDVVHCARIIARTIRRLPVREPSRRRRWWLGPCAAR